MKASDFNGAPRLFANFFQGRWRDFKGLRSKKIAKNILSIHAVLRRFLLGRLCD
jgi:hypothetical protein